MSTPTIIYTKTDEAPLLATYSFLPIIKSFVAKSGINVEFCDISVAARILCKFPERLTAEQKQYGVDVLSQLGQLAQTKEANIIKLPNVSASVPQLKAAIAELQGKGFDIPSYVDTPTTPEEQKVADLYATVKGSAVNPVLREGNSDRRAPPAVKGYAKKYPHSMGAWASDSKTHVSCMSGGDFFANEQSVTVPAATEARIEFVGADSAVKVLKTVPLQAGEVADSTFMSKAALCTFLEEQVADAKAKDVLFSLHMKATMMKISDPIIFGHAVRAFYKPLFDKYQATFDKLSVNVRNGFGDLEGKIKTLPAEERAAIEADIQKIYNEGPLVAQVDSDKGITNLHVPSDVIIDASMPAALRDGGKMWTRDNKRMDMKAVIPDSSYAGVFQAVIDFCRTNGAFNPATMGTCPNVGLMAKAAEEYGSHNKTFEVEAAGTMRVVDSEGKVLMQHTVEAGDIWRMCQAKDAPIRNWVEMAVGRARATNTPAVFWLDEKRAHDAELIKKVNVYLKDCNTEGLDLQIMKPQDACLFSLERLARGEDAISVTGNVLRDYNTDLFPILEVGTSAKMLSIVPLMAGGGMFETGAGGSAPKHVQQVQEENHLRWDSLGEFMALACSLTHIGNLYKIDSALQLSAALDAATERLLVENKGPQRRGKTHDNRGSHFYVALFWAQEMAKVDKAFEGLAKKLADNEAAIVKELVDCQGAAADIGGYYLMDDAKCYAIMRPSATFNAIIDQGLA